MKFRQTDVLYEYCFHVFTFIVFMASINLRFGWSLFHGQVSSFIKAKRTSICGFQSVRRSYSPSRMFASTRNNSEKTNDYTIECDSAEEMVVLGMAVSDFLDTGDLILLRGDLGAGKTTFARGIVQSKMDDYNMVVTSPSYLLDNSYEYAAGKTIHHIDLYRLPSGCDMTILGFPSIFSTSICIIEWPQRLSQSLLPDSYLNVDISIISQDTRKVELKPTGNKWINKMKEFAIAVNEI